MNLPKEEDLELIHYTSIKSNGDWIIQTLTAKNKQGHYYTFFNTGKLYFYDDDLSKTLHSCVLTDEEREYVNNLRISLTITLNNELRKLTLSMSIF